MKSEALNNITNFWRKLTGGSVNRKVFGAIIVVGVGTSSVKGVAVVKELIVAWKFGTGDALDAFLIALLMPAFIINVVAGSVPAALIPTYIKVREQEGKNASQKLLSGITICSITLLFVTAVLMIMTAPLYLPFVAKGFSSEKLNLTFQLLCTMTPMILLSGIITIWTSILNAGEMFVISSLSPASTSVITIGSILTFSSLGVFSLVAGLIFGGIIEIIVLGIALRKQGILLSPEWHGFDHNLRQVSGQYIPMIAGSLLMCSTSLVDQSMAAMLSPGSVAALNYGNRVIALPITLATTALSTVVIPYFSKMAVSQDLERAYQTLKKYLYIVFSITTPLTILFIVFSKQITTLLFQRGAFTTNDTYLVSQIQIYFALQIPFYVSNILVVRMISAFMLNKILMYGAIINLLLNVLMNHLFMQYIGIAGIALSTSCVYLISFLFSLFYLLLHFKEKKS